MNVAAYVKVIENYRHIQMSHNNPCDIWGGYVQNYYQQMFTKRPFKLNKIINLEVNKRKQK